MLSNLLLWTLLCLTSQVYSQDRQSTSILDTDPLHMEDFGVPPATSTILLYDCTGSHRPKPDDPGAFQVFHNGEWWNQFCQDELVWNQTLCRCEYPNGKRPSIECRDYRAAIGNSAQNYEQLVNGNWIVRDCSLAVAGLIWDQTACQCVWGPESKEMVTGQGITPCDIMLNMTFEHGVKDDAKGSFVEVGRGSALPIQTLETRDSFRGTKAAYFTDTALNIWYFAGNEIGTSLRVEFRFKMVNDPAHRDTYQIFLSNGCNVSVPGYTTPSLAIGYRAADQSYLLAFETASARKAIVCTQKLGAYNWHTVSLIYEDGTLLLRIDEKPCIISQDFTGPIQKTSCPLTIGADPLERQSMYKGYLDNLLIARYCRRFIDKDPAEVNDKGPMPIETVPALASQSVPQTNPDRGNNARPRGRVQVSKYWSNFQVNRNQHAENSGKDRRYSSDQDNGKATQGSAGLISASWLTEDNDNSDDTGELVTDAPTRTDSNSNADEKTEEGRKDISSHPPRHRTGGFGNNLRNTQNEESNEKNSDRPSHFQNGKESRNIAERQENHATPRMPERGNDNQGNINRQRNIHNSPRTGGRAGNDLNRPENEPEKNIRNRNSRTNNRQPRPPNTVRIATEAQSQDRIGAENHSQAAKTEALATGRQQSESQSDTSQIPRTNRGSQQTTDARGHNMDKTLEVDGPVTSEKMRERPRREKPGRYQSFEIPASIKDFIDIDRVLHFVDYVEKPVENTTLQSPPSLVKGRRRGGSKKKAWYDKADSEESHTEQTFKDVEQSPFQRPDDRLIVAKNNMGLTKADVVITDVEPERRETETSAQKDTENDSKHQRILQQNHGRNSQQDASKNRQGHQEINRLNRHQMEDNTKETPRTQNRNSNLKDSTRPGNPDIVTQRVPLRRPNDKMTQTPRFRIEITDKKEHVTADDSKNEGEDTSHVKLTISDKHSENEFKQLRTTPGTDVNGRFTDSKVRHAETLGHRDSGGVTNREDSDDKLSIAHDDRNIRHLESPQHQSQDKDKIMDSAANHRAGNDESKPGISMDEVIGWYDKSFTDLYPPYDGTEYENNHKDLKPDPSLGVARRAHTEETKKLGNVRRSNLSEEARKVQLVTSQK